MGELTTRSFKPEAKRRLYDQIDRLDETLSVLAKFKTGATVQDVNQQISRYSVCLRTTRRDLEMLEFIGRAESRDVQVPWCSTPVKVFQFVRPMFAEDAND